jgi:hypothetical protein
MKQSLPLRYAQFSPDGTRVITASDDGTAVVWDIGPLRTEVPSWLLLLAETISGREVNADGVLQRSRLDRIEAMERVRQELRRAPARDQWAIWGRWFLANPLTRTISPYSKLLVTDYENRLKENAVESLQPVEYATTNLEIQQRIQSARIGLQHYKLPMEHEQGTSTEAVRPLVEGQTKER